MVQQIMLVGVMPLGHTGGVVPAGHAGMCKARRAYGWVLYQQVMRGV